MPFLVPRLLPWDLVSFFILTLNILPAPPTPGAPPINSSPPNKAPSIPPVVPSDPLNKPSMVDPYSPVSRPIATKPPGITTKPPVKLTTNSQLKTSFAYQKIPQSSARGKRLV